MSRRPLFDVEYSFLWTPHSSSASVISFLKMIGASAPTSSGIGTTSMTVCPFPGPRVYSRYTTDRGSSSAANICSSDRLLGLVSELHGKVCELCMACFWVRFSLVN